MKTLLIGIFLTLSTTIALMLIPSTQPKAPMPWEVTVMPDGNSKVFGIHLGSSSYLQAQEIFHQYGKTAIFTQENKPPSVEAFFQSINLGGLSAKVILNLDVEQTEINSMLTHAMQARIQPSGARRYELNNEANKTLVDATINAISYIPSIKLDDEKVRYRFVEPSSIKQDELNPNTHIWHYPDLGLSIRLNQHEKTILEYQVKTKMN
jgi:hypothetical protein